MDSAPETKRWVMCPVCHQTSPVGTLFCKHCWGAALRLVRPVSSQEVERTLSRLKRIRMIKSIAIRLVSFIILISVVYLGLYYFTDIVSSPSQSINSNSLLGEWAMFRRDLSHSGVSDSGGALPQGKLKWVFSTEAQIHSSPAVVDGIVYVGSRDFKLYALDAATGAKQWEYKTGSWVESSPVIVNGVVYFGSNDGRLYALAAHNGEKLWDFRTEYAIKSSPAVADGTVYFGSGDYHVYALDAVTGEKLWDFETEGAVDSSPVVANGNVYVGSVSEFFYALNAVGGRLRLNFKSMQPVLSSPAVNGETVYFVNFNGTLYAIDGNARTWLREHEIKPYWVQLWAMGLPLPQPPSQSGFLWGLRLNGTAVSSPTVTDDTLYTGSGNKLVAVDLQSYQKRWEFETGGIIRSSPALVDTTIYVGSEDGRLYAVDATTGEKLWDILAGGKITASPAVADGTVYISSHDGNLYAFE
ncbi:PQQ-binding-like beta-propeller repeat protein [Chloroflexota bacterium]